MSKALLLTQDEIYYNEENKNKFHTAAKKAFRDLAKKLGLEKTEFNIRSNKAGPGSTGEVTFHSDKFYVTTCNDFSTGGHKILYRTCNGQKDYTGGNNQYIGIEQINSETLFNKLKAML